MENDAAGPAGGLPAAGTIIAERYRLVERIAGGGMGDVWEAVDEVLGRTVALKLLRPEYAEDAEFRERLRREARAASAISDAGVVPVFDYGEIERDNAPPLSYLVLEYVDGLSLSAEVSALGTLGADRTILILEQTASALQAAHDAGVIHRDIKPGNIMVTPQGDLKITDFGIAHASDSLPLTRTGTTTGTAKYLSPEQARGLQATEASDLYSLGVVAYACLTGDVPFHDGNDISIALAHVQQQPPELPADVPDGLRELIMRMLEKNPSDRPASAGAVAAAARSLRRHEGDTLEGGHPFPPATPVTDVQPAGSGEPTKTIDAIVPGIAADAVLAVADLAAETVAVPAVETTGAAMAATTEATGAWRSPNRRRRGMILAAVALLVLVGGGIAFAAWQSGRTQVPDVVGKQRDDAQTILKGAGLRAKFITADVPGKKQGIVVKQSSTATVKAGSTITLNVATGKVDVPSAELIGMTYDKAAAKLKSLGLKATKQAAVSTRTPGTVIAVSPDKRANTGATVTLTVAAGPAPTGTTPNGNGSGKTKSTPGPTKAPSTSPTKAPTTTPTSTTPAPTTPTAGGTGAG